MRTFLSTLLGAVLILASTGAAEVDKAVVSSDVDLPRVAGKQVTIEGTLQLRKSGLWLKCGRVAVELPGMKASPGFESASADATGLLTETRRWFDGYTRYSMDCTALKILPTTSASTTKPAVTPKLVNDADLANALERLRGDRVTLAGKPAEDRKSGRWLICGSVTVQLVPGEGERWDAGDMDHAIELTGWLTKVHMPELPPISEPGVQHAAHMGPGDRYALEEAERVMKK